MTRDGTEASWARITEIVDGVLKRPDSRDRVRYLRDACQGDRGLRHEVEKLLRFEDAEDGILAGSLISRPAFPEDGPQVEPALHPDDTIGRFRVKRILGDGGMGVVAQVFDPTLERDVAFKLLRRERVSGEILRRFHDERRILARLVHPGIARIHDGGEIDDLPFFTMEYVDGEPVDEHCDQCNLSVAGRIRLVLEICDALGFAHRNLVVHRDLKPSNILVTANGQPKLLDFGIAKELEPRPAPPRAATRAGYQPLTLAYASPEQVRAQTITVATDVYSLGMLLYELLCGHPPYILDGDAYVNAGKICEEEPPRPSSQAVVAREDWHDGTPISISPATLARQRGTDPQRLRQQLRGDLDSIVLKALAKDPAERYRSMEELADDLRHHLEALPVLAHRATFTYRAGKFLRRHHWRLAAMALLLSLAAVAGTARVRNARQIANLEQDRKRTAAEMHRAQEMASAMRSFADRLLKATDPDVAGGRPLTALEILLKARDLTLRDLSDSPEVLANQLEAVGIALQHRRVPEAARPVFEETLRLRRSVYGRGDHPLVATSLNNLATIYFELGMQQRAAQLYRQALAMKRRLGQPSIDLDRVETNLAAILLTHGEYDEAEQLYRQILATQLRAYGSNDNDVANSLRNLGYLLYARGDLDAAEPVLRNALTIRLQKSGSETKFVASIRSSLGRVLHAQGRFEEAEEMLSETLAIRRKLLGNNHLHAALTRKDLANLYFDLGETAIAQVLWDQALTVIRVQKPSDSWELADANSQLGARLMKAERFAEAEPCLIEGHQTLSQKRGEGFILTQQACRRLDELHRHAPLEQPGTHGRCTFMK